MTAAPPSVRPALMLTVRMLRPLPGQFRPPDRRDPGRESGDRDRRDQRPRRDLGLRPGQRHQLVEARAHATDSGAMTSANPTNRYDSAGSGHVERVLEVGDRSGDGDGEARRDQRRADRSGVPGAQAGFATANSAPPSGTLYTAPRPAPAAQASRISRSRAVSAHRDVPEVAETPRRVDGAHPRVRAMRRTPTRSTCSPASSDMPQSGDRSVLVDRRRQAGHVRRGAAASTSRDPQAAPPIMGPTARRTGLLSPTPVEQRAEGVVVGEVFDACSSRVVAAPATPASRPITNTRACVLNGAPRSRMNLSCAQWRFHGFCSSTPTPTTRR